MSTILPTKISLPSARIYNEKAVKRLKSSFPENFGDSAIFPSDRMMWIGGTTMLIATIIILFNILTSNNPEIILTEQPEDQPGNNN